MAERTSVKSPVSAFATRLGPALSIGIVLGAVLIAFLIGLWLTFGGDLGPLADPIPNQNQPTEESVPTEEPFPTNTPSPTATESPPTETPTQTPTVTLTPTVTQTPYPTPEMPWDYYNRRTFVADTALNIMLSHNFRAAFPCVKQGKGWSENADPFVMKYLDGVIEECICYEESYNHWFDLTEEEDGKVLEEIRLGNIEVIDIRNETEEIGEYTLCTSNSWSYYYQYLYDLEALPWEWALFVERNYRFYGWEDHFGNNWDWETRTVWVRNHIERVFGDPKAPWYAPNFDPNSPYYMIESKRLKLGEYAE